MNNEQFKMFVETEQAILEFIEKRARQKYASEFGVSIHLSEVEEWVVETNTNTRVITVSWVVTPNYDDFFIDYSIPYEELELTEEEFNERYPICQ